MKERPIIFNTAMVQAIIAGKKTQTRRVVKPYPCGYEPVNTHSNQWEFCCDNCFEDEIEKHRSQCPYGVVGDQLWVRETWKPFWDDELFMSVKYKANDAVIKPDITDNNDGHKFAMMFNGEFINASEKWRPSIHMPRWAARITLEITAIRVEKVYEISVKDALAEGITHNSMNCPRVEFQWLWDSINMKRGYGWDTDPWVWVVEFKVI